jgi:glucokinase
MADSPHEDYWIGFDLGGTKMLSAVFDASFEILGRERKKTKGHEGTDSVTSRMVTAISESLKDANIEPEQLSGIGVGCPGPVDQNRGIVHEAVNLGWENVRLGDLLEKEFGCPAVVVNDVDAGVYGEYRFGAGKSARTVLGVFPGTGIGGGCVYDGEILHGKETSCLELGHMLLNPDGRLCGCGRYGCLETEASRLAIASEAITAAYRGEAPHLLDLAGTDVTKVRSGILAQAIKEGDSAIEDIVRRAAEKLGRAIGSIVHLLAPDVVVLGGGLVEAMPDLYIKQVKKAANATVMPSFADSFKVVVAELGDNSTICGSAAWIQQRTGKFAGSSQ